MDYKRDFQTDGRQLEGIVWTRMARLGNGDTSASGRNGPRGPTPGLDGRVGGQRTGAEDFEVQELLRQDYQCSSSSEEEVVQLEENVVTRRVTAAQRAAEERIVLQQLHGVRRF